MGTVVVEEVVEGEAAEAANLTPKPSGEMARVKRATPKYGHERSRMLLFEKV